jgi:diadenosine tetraphosphatase ApaH/serine/threonine PP2A family protein phosphatase
MRVAALYDIHGMPWALEAVLADLDADAVVFGGDLAWGPYPRETLELVRSVDGNVVRGNTDREPDLWLARSLSDGEIEWLRSLPFSAAVDDVYYCHATPRSDVEVITRDTADEILDELLAGIDHRFVVGGHTHTQLRRGRFVNAGSVGMPYEDEVAAFWAVIEGEVEFRRTAFDVERAIAAVRRSAWPLAPLFADQNLARRPSRDEAVVRFRPRGT